MGARRRLQTSTRARRLSLSTIPVTRAPTSVSCPSRPRPTPRRRCRARTPPSTRYREVGRPAVRERRLRRVRSRSSTWGQVPDDRGSYDASTSPVSRCWQLCSYMTSRQQHHLQRGRGCRRLLRQRPAHLTHNKPAGVCNQVPTWLRGVNTSSPRAPRRLIDSEVTQACGRTG